MSKKGNPSTPPVKKEKRVYEHVEDYFNLNSWKMQPLSVEGLERKAYELTRWVEDNPKAL